MPQFNIFGEVEADIMVMPEIIPEPVIFAMPQRKGKKRKDFEIGKCRACGQLLLDDPDNKINNELCPMCDERLRARYHQFRNIALAKALRIRKHY
jgi:predicted RNA-binding Zn-ribbon protein involved in translation (DUF1610 family)